MNKFQIGDRVRTLVTATPYPPGSVGVVSQVGVTGRWYGVLLDSDVEQLPMDFEPEELENES